MDEFEGVTDPWQFEALWLRRELGRLQEPQERAKKLRGAVPERDLIAAWAASPKATTRAQAIAAAELLAMRGFGHLPGSRPAAIERRGQRIRARGLPVTG